MRKSDERRCSPETGAALVRQCRAWHRRSVALAAFFRSFPAVSAVCTAFAQPVALSLKISTERRIIGLTEGFDELRKADTSCAERILGRQNDVAEQNLALFRQVSFQSGSRKMDRTTSLAATSGAHFPRVRQIEQSLIVALASRSPVTRMICRPTIAMGNFVPTISINRRQFIVR
jgi:hypothetical protein